MRSMTGFGRGEASSENYIVSIELSSVNRKQAEVITNLPKSLAEHEPKVKKQILKVISRGRVNANITIAANDSLEAGLVLDLEKANVLEHQFSLLSKQLGREIIPNTTDFLRIPNVFKTVDLNVNHLFPLLDKALANALKVLVEMREREGEDLKRDSKERIDVLTELLEKITAHAPLVLENHRENLIKKLQDLDLPIKLENLEEDERILKEIALFADRCDISEEITRFHSHLDKFKEYLSSNSAIGRSLDFLCQELHRELNTIGSKANNATLAHYVVNGKTEVEKIREQIQNVE